MVRQDVRECNVTTSPVDSGRTVRSIAPAIRLRLFGRPTLSVRDFVVANRRKRYARRLGFRRK
jgi:hypothetical protein